MDSWPVAVDLFAGCGGLTEGLTQAKFRVLGAIEIDPLAAESYRMNHAAHVWVSDIRNLDPLVVLDELDLAPGELDLLAGCPPCQGFSTLRTRRQALSVADDRNDLVYEFMRFVDVMRPKAVMMENVPNLANDPRMAHILEHLRRAGYYAEHDAVRVLDASHYGVPQRRRRMILLSGQTGPVPFARAQPAQQTVRSALHHLHSPGQGSDNLHDYTVRRSERIERLIRLVPKNGGSRKDLPEDLQLACHRRTNGFSDVYGRMAWDAVAPTITSGCFNPSKGRFLHPDENRAITLREAALLQTFPERYRLSLRRGREATAAMIGNALPPEFIRRHAELIRNYVAPREDSNASSSR